MISSNSDFYSQRVELTPILNNALHNIHLWASELGGIGEMDPPVLNPPASLFGLNCVQNYSVTLNFSTQVQFIPASIII